MPVRNRSDQDFAREIEGHIELETERLMVEGMSREDARRAAKRRFGNVTRATERFYESRRVPWLDHLQTDVRSAIRSIARTPMACIVAIVSLAAGIGATTATLTLRNAIFYNPPPLYREPQQLSTVFISTPERRRAGVPGGLFVQWSSTPDLGASMAAALPTRSVQVRVDDKTAMVRWRAVTPDFFAQLGVAPALGRTFSASAGPDGSPPIVLSHAVWQNAFAGRVNVLGTVVWVDREAHTVIGVMPPRFWFAATDAAVWTAIRPASLADHAAVDVVVRRPAGLTPAALLERLQRDATEYAGKAGTELRELRILVSPIRGTALGSQIAIVVPWLVGAAVFLTLLIACANVAILMFARWTSREREMSVRSCLGASRGRAFALLLTESVVLAVVGGILGVCATFALRGLFVRNVPDAMNYNLSIDGVILLQAMVVTLLAGIVSGIAPALWETRRLQTNPLRLMASGDRVRQRWRHALVILEISVTVALMVAAATQVDASRRMLTANLGLAAESLMIARVENPSGVDVQRVLDAIRRVPGVDRAAAGTGLPMGASSRPEPVLSAMGDGALVSAERVRIGTDYFATLGAPLRAGRTFSDADLAAPSRIVVINETLARHLWGDGVGLSGRIVIDKTPYEVVGIVAAYASSPMRTAPPRFYLPLTRNAKEPTRVEIAVRAIDDPVPIVRSVRQEIGGLGSTYAVPYAFALHDVIKAGAGEIMVLALAMSPLLGIGMFLTASGIFGVLAFAIARRSNELALRMALGANPASVARLVVAHTFILVATGSLAGVAGTYALTRLVRAAGGGGSSFDTPGWQAFAIPVLIIVTVGTLATWIPTRRAMSVDPARLLRTE